MCGIIAFSGKEKFNKDKIKLLLYWNSIERGKDATGIYTPTTGIIKDIKEAKDFISRIQEEVKDDNLFIGHVRSKTRGANSVNNAHPFKYDNVIGVHNGTLTNEHELCRLNDMTVADFDVDSKILFAAMAKSKNTDVLSQFKGAAAIVFTDTNNPSILYVFKNSERTLFRGRLDEGMYISSIKSSLEAINCKDIKEFKDDCLYKIKDGDIIFHQKIKRPVEDTYKHSYYNRSLVYKSPHLLVGKWVKAKNDETLCWGKPIRLVKNKYYKVLGVGEYNTTYSIYIIDENANKVDVTMYYFDLDDILDMSVGDYVICITRLVLINDPTIVRALPDQTFLVVGAGSQKDEIEVYDHLTGNRTIANKIFFRPAQEHEVESYIKLLKNKEESEPQEEEVKVESHNTYELSEGTTPDKIIKCFEDISSSLEGIKESITKNKDSKHIIEQINDIDMQITDIYYNMFTEKEITSK